MAETNEFYIKIGADVDDAMNKLNRLSSQLSQLASSTQRSSNQIGGSMSDASKAISSAFGAMGLALTTAGITAAIVGIGKAALSTAAELEQISISFRVFTGSAETANKMLAQLKEQALNSPMQFQDITKGAQTLLQYGLNAQQVIPITRMLGDISGGNADRFSRLALAFGQVAASGRLMGQEARQMINAGFNPLKAISDATGQSMATLTQKMHDGQISVQDVAMAFLSATSEGGQFFGMADEQAKTLGGLFNKLSESVTFALADIGESIKNTFDIAGIVLILNNSIGILKDSFRVFNSEGDKSTVWATLFKGAIVGLTIALDLLIKTFKLLKLGAEEIIGTWGKRLGQVISYTSEKIFASLQNAPGIGGVTNGINNYFKNIIEKATSANSNVKKSKSELEKLRDEYEKILKTFSDDPSKKQSIGKKSERIEVIVGTDFITKDVGSKIKAFIQENKDAATTISNWWSTSDTKRLAELKKNYEKDVAFANKYGLDLVDIEKKYNSEIDLIVKKFSEGKVSARENARKKMIEQSTNDVADALTKQSRTLNGLFTTLKADDARNSLGQFASSIYAAQRDFAMNISVGFAEIAGAAFAGAFNVQDAFKALGSMFTSAIGDLLIKVGTAAIELGLFKEGIETALKSIGGGAGMVALGIAAIAAGSALKSYSGKITDSMSTNKAQTTSSAKSTSSGMTSGSSYQYGGASYSTQSLKLSIDLTGAITATQTGYQINKSLETVLRVTGR